MFLDADEWTLYNVYLRPDQNAGKKDNWHYWPVPREDRDDPVAQSFGSDPIALWYATRGKAMRTLGCSEEEIRQACDEWLHPGGAGTGYTGPAVAGGGVNG